MSERAHLTCPSCGRSAQREGSCKSCGTRIDQTATAGVGIAATQAGVVVAKGGALRIGTRGGEIRECPHCGASVPAAKGKTCPYCQQSLVIEELSMTRLEVKAGGRVTITGRVTIGRGLLDDALLAAVLKGDKPRVYKLTAKGLSLAHGDVQRRTALHHVILARRIDLIDFVVAEGAPIDGQTKKGDTALHLAVEADLEEAVVTLLRLGASPDVTNVRGISSFELAERRSNRAIIERLSDARRSLRGT